MCASPCRYGADDEIFCWLSNTGHWPDIGGAVPGGFSASATAVEQEGLAAAAGKTLPQGRARPANPGDHLFQHPHRRPRASATSRRRPPHSWSARTGCSELLDRYGDETVVDAIAERAVRAAEQMRARHRDHPRRHYRSTAYVDSDGVVDEPLAIRLSVEKNGDELTFDFARLQPALHRADEQRTRDHLLSPSISPCAISFPDVPMSAGAFEPLTMPTGRKATSLDARYPRPVSGCAGGGLATQSPRPVFAALVQAIPDKVTAAPAGSSGNFRPFFLAGMNPERGRDSRGSYQLSGGGYFGGNADHRRAVEWLFGIHRHIQIAADRDHGAEHPILYRH